MKTTLLTCALLLTLAACDSDDYDVWTVTLEPETVLYNGIFGFCYEGIPATTSTGKSWNFSRHEIKGFEYEDGYRYVLQVTATPVTGIADAPPYTFELRRIISQEKVPFDESKRHIEEMNVRHVIVRDSTMDDRYFLPGYCCQTVGTGEELYFKPGEILDFHPEPGYSYHIKVSVTPSSRTYNGKNDKYRLTEVLDRKEEQDSIIIGSIEEYISRY